MRCNRPMQRGRLCGRIPNHNGHCRSVNSVTQRLSKKREMPGGQSEPMPESLLPQAAWDALRRYQARGLVQPGDTRFAEIMEKLSR